MESARGPPSGADAGASLTRDGLHAVLGHEFQLLELADPPMLVSRERGYRGQRRQFLVIVLVLGPEPAKLLVLGRQSCRDVVLIHAWPPLETQKASAITRSLAFGTALSTWRPVPALPCYGESAPGGLFIRLGTRQCQAKENAERPHEGKT